MFEMNNFDAIRIGLASPEKIREWSRGEVKKPETINYRTLKPEDGLFCERIFDPRRTGNARGKYRGSIQRYSMCGVEVTVRRLERAYSIDWQPPFPTSVFQGHPQQDGIDTDMSPRALEKILYFAAYVVIDPAQTPLSKKQILTEKEYRDSIDTFGYTFKAGMGAEAVKELLMEIDLDKLSKELREELEDATGQKRIRTIKRLEVVESFRLSGNRPEWMILDVIPVIPPELRPMVQLDGGRFATSDLNDLYRRVINRNNRLKRLLDLGAPDIIVRNERMLRSCRCTHRQRQERASVTGRATDPEIPQICSRANKRFRQNLLGKRVDYSGRSVIVVGPELKITSAVAQESLELFKPHHEKARQ